MTTPSRTTTTTTETTAGPARRLMMIGLALLATVLLAACSSDAEAPTAGPGEAQAGVGGDLVSASLSDVPVPTAADPTGSLVEEEGRQTQSYIVTATAPDAVQDFYAEELPALGWAMEDIERLPEGITSTWTDGPRDLLVSTSPEGQDTSLSLQVSDADAGVPGVTATE